jgi:hypothetical protein
MFTDARLRAAAVNMMRDIEAPPVPLSAILSKIVLPPHAVRRNSNAYAISAAAAIAVIAFLSLGTVAPGFVQGAEARIAAILHWAPPPPAPQGVWSAMRAQSGALAAAQARVPFTIVPPAGLPADVASEKIYTESPGTYSRATHAWSSGAMRVVFFDYHRPGGRSFELLARKYDPREAPPSKYTFEDMDYQRNGQEVILKREKFVWRNGDQIMSANAGDGITASEIKAIRAAMHGTPIAGVWPPAPGRSTEMMYRLP